MSRSSSTCSLWILLVASLLTLRAAEAERGQAVQPVQAILGADAKLPEYHALIVAINDYKEWQDLLQPTRDARELADLLKSDYGFTDLRLLLDEQATRRNILNELHRLLDLDENHAVLIYFAGHGLLDKKLKEGYWIPADAPRNSPADYVPNVMLEQYVKQMKARHVLIVADACFSGTLLHRGTDDKLPDRMAEYHRRMLTRPGRYVISSGDLETVPDASVFSTKFLNQLRYREAKEPVVSGMEMGIYLQKVVPEFTKQTPLSGRLKNDPRDEGGQFLFVRRAVTTVASIPSVEPSKPTSEPKLTPLQAKEAESKQVETRIADLRKKLAANAAGENALEELDGLLLQRDQLAKEFTALRKADFEADYARYVRLRESEETTNPAVVQRAWESLTKKWQVASPSPKPGILFWVEGKAFGGGTPATATKAFPFENSLGMKFVPVAGTEVLFSVWHTRVQDYQAFASATGRAGEKPDFAQGPTHPVVNVSWDDAKAFCAWLTEKERGEGKLTAGQSYRLPQDWEWSVAVGLNEARAGTPKDKDAEIKGVYPWGNQWPPPRGAGNYDPSLNADDYERTSPVGSFLANKFGLYDMGGNAWQWCEDWFNSEQKYRVLRGGSWVDCDADALLSSVRGSITPDGRYGYGGFRLVLVGGMSR